MKAASFVIWESKLFVFFIPLDLVAAYLICELVPTHFAFDKLAPARVTATPYTAKARAAWPQGGDARRVGDGIAAVPR